MSDTTLYTIREIARQLALPESTVRYYRDAFVAFVPAVGVGRRRRYPSSAVAILRSVAQGFAAGKNREEIAAELRSGPGPHVEHRPPVLATREPTRQAALEYDELLATILDGERERREAMWQMAREIVRLGEAIERQQAVLGDVAEGLADQANRALTAGSATPAAQPSPQDAPAIADPAPTHPSELLEELESLQEKLDHERELVERLRRSKLAIERRAAEAEARLVEREPPRQRRSLLRRLVSREPLEGDQGG